MFNRANIPFSVKKPELIVMFQHFEKVKIMLEKSFAKLSFESHKNAQMAIKGVDVEELYGTETTLVFAKTDKY